MSLLELLDKGGPVMAVLLLLSVCAVAIVLLKFYQFARLQIWNSDFIDPLLAALPAANSAEILGRLTRENSPVARVIESAVRGFADRRMLVKDIEADVRRVGSREIQALESLLRPLAAIAHLAPLLGLLGTVLGMISAFQQLQGAGMRVNPAVLAGGIWEALLTTAVGLVIAIPAMAAYYFLEGEVDKVRARMKDAAVTLFIRYGEEISQSGSASEPRRVGQSYGV